MIPLANKQAVEIMVEYEVAALKQKMTASYPSSIERRIGAAIASDLQDEVHDNAGGNGHDRLSLEALNRYSPSLDATAHAIAHYLTIRDDEDLAVTNDNAADLAIAMLHMACDHDEQSAPTPELEQQIRVSINDALSTGDGGRETDQLFQMPDEHDIAKAAAVYQEAVMREKGKAPSRWTDQIMSAAIAATAGATGDEITTDRFATRAQMAIARYYSEGQDTPKLEYLHGITTRLTADVRHMEDMSDLLGNIERSQHGDPVDKKWASAVKIMAGRKDLGNIRHDAAGHYHLLPKSEQTAIQWDLEYANNLTREEKLRVEAQTKRVIKAWKFNPNQARETPYILRKAHELQQGR